MKAKQVHIILLAAIILLSALPLMGQSDGYDKYRRQNANVLLRQANDVLKSKPEQALGLVEQALSLSYEKGDLNAEAEAHFTRGNIHFYQGNHLLGIQAYNRALPLYERLGKREKQQALFNQKALSLEQTGNDAEALQLFQKIFTNSTQSESGELLLKIASLQEKLGNKAQARSSYEQSYQLAKITGDTLLMARVSDIIDKGQDSAAWIGNVQQEVGYNQKQLQSIPQKRSKKAELNYDIGSRYLQQNQPQKAIEYFNNTVELTKAEESYPAFEAPKDFEPARLDTDGLAEIDSIITPGPRLEEETEDESELDDEESIVVGETNPGTTPGPEQPSNTVDRPAFKEEIEPIMPSPEKSAKKVAFDSLLELRSATYRKLAEAYALDKNYLKAWEFGQKALQEADSARKQEVQLLQSAASNREALALREQRIITLEQDRKLQAEQLRSQRLLNFGLGALLIAIVLGGLLLWRIQRKRRRASQLLTLRSLVGQMNPHFIFNSLNTFNSYIATADTQRANRFLGDFSRLIRQVLEYSGHDFVTLSRELEILGLYLKLEHGRFEEHFDYELNISPELDLDAIQIPPMLLQPYVENAIWHGLRYREDKGMLHINMFSNNHKTYIVITDNGIGRSKSHELKTHNQQQRSNSLGMKNTARRAALVQSLLKKRLQIHVSDLATDPNYPGTRVELVISD